MGLLRSKSRSQQRFKMLVNVCPDDIFWTTEHFVTKPSIVMQHHKPECHAEKKWFTVFNVKVTARVYIIKIWLFFALSSKLLVCLQPNLVWWYSIISQSVLWKHGITAFKVKVTVKIQNVSEWLFALYFFHVSDRVHSVSLEPLKHLLPNLVRWCIIMSWCVMRKNWFTIFNVKVTARAYIIKIWLFTISSKLLHCLQPDLVW